MKIEAKDLKAGQTIKTEYGDYDNWVNFNIDKVTVLENSVSVSCHYKSIQNEFSYGINEIMEVVQDECI